VEWRDFFAGFGGSDAGTATSADLKRGAEWQTFLGSPHLITSILIIARMSTLTLKLGCSGVHVDFRIIMAIFKIMEYPINSSLRPLPRTNAVG
jgi:uncharacterized membrane protein (DUF4010 family)